ncbi:MAG: thermonuclease family protein [Clostridia bacterium]|nr:thermonuclease family protein [Clostridia bacterium]
MNKKFLLIIFTIICLMIPAVYAVNTESGRIEVGYIKTSDGDTARFMLDGENVRVRFLGINTPEVAGENKVEEPYGNEASLYTKNKLENAKKIEIEYDDVADREDRYGRKLAWIWVDDELLEIELLEQGLAKTYMLKNNYRYATELKEAESKAKDQKIGLWNDTEANSKETNNLLSDEPEENATKESNPKSSEATESETFENEIVKNETIENQTIEPYTPEDNKESGIQIDSYAVVVIVIFIIILLLKNKSKRQ